MKRHALRIVIVLASAGWLVPAWLGLRVWFGFVDAELWPRLQGAQPQNSFSFTQVADTCFTAALAWLAVVVVAWSWVGASALLRGRATP